MTFQDRFPFGDWVTDFHESLQNRIMDIQLLVADGPLLTNQFCHIKAQIPFLRFGPEKLRLSEPSGRNDIETVIPSRDASK